MRVRFFEPRLWRRIQWKLIYFGPRHKVTVEALNGRLTFWSDDRVIGRQLFVERCYEFGLMREAVGLLRREGYLLPAGRGIVVDVGANIGMTCIGLLQGGYFERAVAFEPAPGTFRLLERNVRQNDFADRVLHFPYALSQEDGEVDLELSRHNSGDHRVRVTRQAGADKELKRRSVRVPAKTLDHVLASSNLPFNERDIRLVWADVQGHEGHFFVGARCLLGCGVPVVTEFWPYAILRSGMSQADYRRIVSDLFTHFYVFTERGCSRHEIGEISQLFETLRASEQWCNLILFRRSVTNT